MRITVPLSIIALIVSGAAGPVVVVGVAISSWLFTAVQAGGSPIAVVAATDEAAAAVAVTVAVSLPLTAGVGGGTAVPVVVGVGGADGVDIPCPSYFQRRL